MFHGHILTVEAEGSFEAFIDLIDLIEKVAPYMMDNVVVQSVINRDGSQESFGETVRLVLPKASAYYDNGDQAVIYTGVTVLDSEQNPSIPAGETQVVEWTE